MTRNDDSANSPDPTDPTATTRDDAETTATEDDVFVVGVGASAGGLAALEAFFAACSPQASPAVGFVVLQHLAPDQTSSLVRLISHHTELSVVTAEDGASIEANHIYVMPPNREVYWRNGRLRMSIPGSPRDRSALIDHFLLSLAPEKREKAVAVVLSGSGSDGSAGVRAIKANGGLVFAQTPETAQFDGMPSSALATGVVDHELAPAEIPPRLMVLATRTLAVQIVPEVGLKPMSAALHHVFGLLLAHTGHDFSHYKPRTIQRRIERRMAQHRISTAEAYLDLLTTTPAEVDALFADMLIGVTSFFRDTDPFRVLESHLIPDLFEGRAPGAAIRAWTAGCSTGEEAYSLAILLHECMDAQPHRYDIKIFATDIDFEAIAVARAGRYPKSIETAVSAARLARFFTTEPDGGGYRVHKRIRDLLVFSEQDLIRDPPFSHLDLISCRNVLIYLGEILQQRVLSVFHFALKPSGLLFLGTSEGLGNATEMFAVLDRKAKLFRRRDGFQGRRRAALQAALPRLMRYTHTNAFGAATGELTHKPSMREIAEQALLHALAPTAALIDAQGEILFLHGRTGLYLELEPGEVRGTNT